MGKETGLNRTQKRGKSSYDLAEKDQRIQESSYVFCDHLRTARESKGYTQKDMDDRLGYKIGTYRKIEQGVNRKDLPHFIRSLADLLDVSSDYLVGISNNPHPEYGEVIDRTGLSDKTITKLRELHAIDGGETETGYLDFINCLLGNGELTELFLEAIQPTILGLSLPEDDGCSMSSTAEEMMYHAISEHFIHYLRKVVIPSLRELRKGNNDAGTTLSTEE